MQSMLLFDYINLSTSNKYINKIKDDREPPEGEKR